MPARLFQYQNEKSQLIKMPKNEIRSNKMPMQSISPPSYSPAPTLLPPLARPTAPAPGKACPAWSSPWSPCRPVNATSLVRGAWWNSLLLFSRVSAWLELILTASFTCLFRQLLKLLKAVIVKVKKVPCTSKSWHSQEGVCLCSQILQLT